MDTSKAVAIVGFASSSRHQAPFDNPNFEIWTMNHAPLSWIPKWDVLFEIHNMEHLKATAAHSTQPGEYLAWLSKQPGPGAEGHRPIYMLERHEDIPASVPLPRAELNAWFAERGASHVYSASPAEKRAAAADGFYADDYYTSTISWMLAVAIMQGRKEIHLYGIDLLQEEEYFYQRAGAEYLAGFARGMGIKVYIPAQSAMCKASYTYGYTFPAESGIFEPIVKYLEDKAGLCDNHVAKARQDAHTFNGALQMADLVLGWLAAPPEGKTTEQAIREKREEMEKRFKTAEQAGMTLTGQAEAFKTCGIWVKHHARGGALNL